MFTSLHGNETYVVLVIDVIQIQTDMDEYIWAWTNVNYRSVEKCTDKEVDATLTGLKSSSTFPCAVRDQNEARGYFTRQLGAILRDRVHRVSKTIAVLPPFHSCSSLYTHTGAHKQNAILKGDSRPDLWYVAEERRTNRRQKKETSQQQSAVFNTKVC